MKLNGPVMMGHFRVVIPLWAMYLGMTAHVGTANLVVGLLLSIGISILVYPPEWHVRSGSVFRAVSAALVYVTTLLLEIARCGIDVSRRVLRPTPNISPGIIAVKTGSNADAIAAVSAHGITITPGEMVVAIGEDGTLYTHALDSDASMASAEQGQHQRERRLGAVLGTNDVVTTGET